MKKLVLFLSVVYLSILGAFAQNIQITDGNNAYNTGDSIFVYKTATYVDSILDLYIYVENTSNDNYNAKVRRTNISTATGSVNSYCWGMECYPPNVDLSDAAELRPGQDIEVHGEYHANGSPDKTFVRYAAFDEANPNDSTWVIVVFFPNSGVGIDDDAAKVIEISPAYPNPANNLVNVDYQFSPDMGQVKFMISDLLGNTVKTMNVENAQGKVTMLIDDLENGVYFYSFLTESDILITRKLVVRH